MLTIILALTTCPKTIIYDKTKVAWTAHDTKTLQYCKERCKTIYTDSPCLKQFHKLSFQNYIAICGK